MADREPVSEYSFPFQLLLGKITELTEQIKSLQREIDLLRDQVDLYWNPKI